MPTQISYRVDRGREYGTTPREVAPPRPRREIVLGHVARLGLALLVTAGFASGLTLHMGAGGFSPNMMRGCEGVFLWTLALVTAGARE